MNTDSTKTATATTATATKTKTTKTAPAKTPAKAPVKPAKKAAPKTPAKPAKKATPAKKVAKPAKKAAPKTKKPAVKKERKVKSLSENVSPVIATLNGLITSADTSIEDLKSLRLELRKFVRASRSILKARKNAPVKTVKVAKKVVAPKAEAVAVEVAVEAKA